MQINICQFEVSKDAIQKVREIVFEQEQGVSRELERDGLDNNCIHVLAINKDKKPVGTGRLQLNGKIGRMAVIKEYRGSGIGGKMLMALIKAGSKKNMNQLVLNAQKTAIDFYKKYGFEILGEEFLEADMLHMKMVRHLEY